MDDQPLSPSSVRVLTRAQISRLMTPADYLEAVTLAFAALAEGAAASPAPMHLAAAGGGFHVKAAADPQWAVVKINGNFPANPGLGLPTIQGALLLCDARTGAPRAIMDSVEVTRRRTAAATALAARYLARPEAARVLICGCGDQAMAQLEALGGVLPLASGFACDLDGGRATDFVRAAAGVVRLSPVTPGGLAAAARASDVVVTCTTSQAPFLGLGSLAAGTFVAAVGADSPAKSEIDPDLMANARVFVDHRDQALAMGDLRHAVAAGRMAADDVAGDLADLVAGRVAGRTGPAEITLFDSTGVAVQDLYSAAAIFRRAEAEGVGSPVALCAA